MSNGNVLPLRLRRARHTIAAAAGGVTIDQLQRSQLAVEAALNPLSQSTLIALLAGATPEEREAIIRELEVRR